MKKEAINILKGLSYILCIAFALSLLAQWHWFFDLFSNFANQYMVGGAILLALLVSIKSYPIAIACMCVSLLSFLETRLVLNHPFQFIAPKEHESILEDKQITLVQYNHNIGKTNFKDAQEWLRKHSHNFDIITLQEASDYTIDMANNLKELYPYQLHEQRRNQAFGMVILSKHKISEQKIFPFIDMPYANFLIRLKVEMGEDKTPITIYALHATPPISKISQMQRNKELEITAQEISRDESENIALIGDWNLTPTSPYFKKLKKESNLKYQSFGVFLNPTWANNHYFSFLKIPIDHVLYSNNMRVLDKEVGPSFGSDHNSLITTIGIF